jgi:hypothetical protein
LDEHAGIWIKKTEIAVKSKRVESKERGYKGENRAIT